MFWNEYLLSLYPESSKSLLFGGDLTLLFEQYRGQLTTIARKLCLQSFRHLRQKSLYVLLPVLGLIKKSHSCFSFFDNLAIEKTPFIHLDKGCLNAHPKSPDFKKFFITPSLVWTGKRKNGGVLKRKLKAPSLVWNRKRFLGGVFEKFLKNIFLLLFWKQKQRFPPITIKWKKSVKQKISYRFVEPRGEGGRENIKLWIIVWKQWEYRLYIYIEQTVFIRAFLRPDSTKRLKSIHTYRFLIWADYMSHIFLGL